MPLNDAEVMRWMRYMNRELEALKKGQSLAWRIVFWQALLGIGLALLALWRGR